MFDDIDNWVGSSEMHFYAFILFTMIITIVGCFMLVKYSAMMGPANAENNFILLKVFRSMYIFLLLLLSFFITFAPRGMIYFRQYILFFVTVSIFFGGCLTAYYYKKFYKK
ncbi:hypothetical protein [Mycoplasma sp. P36-A1]|uniref:hypothetical protein n=1 Tax=Mycoplasma sp. P36-A1 TaxID=3252900 RepID=UPI003C2F7AE0